MTRYILSPLARADLDNIWEYTAKRWDDDQAEAYLRMIQAAFDTVAANPKLGRRYDEVRAGYRRYRAGSHLILYRETSDAIDIGSHLQDPNQAGPIADTLVRMWRRHIHRCHYRL